MQARYLIHNKITDFGNRLHLHCLLIIEPSSVVRKSIRRTFEGAGWKVCGEAADIPEAMAMAAEFSPDIIVLDFPFPPLPDFLTVLPLKEAIPSAQIILFTFSDMVRFLHPLPPMFSAVVSKTDAATLLAKAEGLVVAA